MFTVGPSRGVPMEVVKTRPLSTHLEPASSRSWIWALRRARMATTIEGASGSVRRLRSDFGSTSWAPATRESDFATPKLSDLQVNFVPTKPEDLALAHPGGEGQEVERFEPLPSDRLDE